MRLYAGHTAMIADYHKGTEPRRDAARQWRRPCRLTDWKSRARDMKDSEIDNYLAEMIVAIDDLGGRVSISSGLCQGGWVSAMVAARFPDKVNSLAARRRAHRHRCGGRAGHAHGSRDSGFVLRGAGRSSGGGLMQGKFMLQGWKNMHPEQHLHSGPHSIYIEHIDDPATSRKEEIFDSWYENPIDLPGRWYLQVDHPALQGEPASPRATFVGLGRRLDLRNIACPSTLLAGAADDITDPSKFSAPRIL